MNNHFFSTKRAFHATLRFTRKPLASLGLTAARYDLLHTLSRSGWGKPRGIAYPRLQSELRRELGVTKSVISRMLQSLEKLGFVTRERSLYGDRRQRHVSLTGAGLQRMQAAWEALGRAAQRLLGEAICWDKYRDRYRVFQHLCELESYLFAMRRHFGDAATLVLYPWHPDD